MKSIIVNVQVWKIRSVFTTVGVQLGVILIATRFAMLNLKEELKYSGNTKCLGDNAEMIKSNISVSKTIVNRAVGRQIEVLLLQECNKIVGIPVKYTAPFL